MQNLLSKTKNGGADESCIYLPNLSMLKIFLDERRCMLGARVNRQSQRHAVPFDQPCQPPFGLLHRTPLPARVSYHHVAPPPAPMITPDVNPQPHQVAVFARRVVYLRFSPLAGQFVFLGLQVRFARTLARESLGEVFDFAEADGFQVIFYAGFGLRQVHAVQTFQNFQRRFLQAVLTLLYPQLTSSQAAQYGQHAGEQSFL